MPKIFFTSDLHFGHKNIIRFDNRPFSTVEEMDEALIRNWNAKVSDEDTVYVLGDISWYNDAKTSEIINSLHGHKILIKGNHDRVHGKVRVGVMVQNYEPVTFEEVLANYEMHRKMTTGCVSECSDKEKAEAQNG